MIHSIKIKYLSDIKPLEPFNNGDWIDLRSAENVDLECGEFYVIKLGVAMELPEGYEAHIVPRSSTYKKWGIIQVNNVGIIDNSYKGDNDEWMLPVIALRKTHIHKNDRICQFRIVKNQGYIMFDKVKSLGNNDRGGFGSTGVN